MKKQWDFDTVEGRAIFYRSKQWRAMRSFMLSENPLCVECKKKGIIKVACDCDHIIDVKDDPSRCLDYTNLQMLCKPCHGKKTRTRQTGYNDNNSTLYNKMWDVKKLLRKK